MTKKADKRGLVEEAEIQVGKHEGLDIAEGGEAVGGYTEGVLVDPFSFVML